MKRIPYGISNFEVLREKNYLYVDKTSYIELLDNYAPYQFFIQSWQGYSNFYKLYIAHIIGKKLVSELQANLVQYH